MASYWLVYYKWASFKDQGKSDVSQNEYGERLRDRSRGQKPRSTLLKCPICEDEDQKIREY